jgi:hypothetical protein
MHGEVKHAEPPPFEAKKFFNDFRREPITYQPGGYATNDCIRRDVCQYHRLGGDHGSGPDGYAAPNEDILPNPYIVPDLRDPTDAREAKWRCPIILSKKSGPTVYVRNVSHH